MNSVIQKFIYFICGCKKNNICIPDIRKEQSNKLPETKENSVKKSMETKGDSGEKLSEIYVKKGMSQFEQDLYDINTF
jgi:hypothetical protein